MADIVGGAGAAEHIVKSYEQELRRLKTLISEMGGIVESQVASACAAVTDHDSASAMRAVEADPRVDAMEREVEQFVIRLMALRQPMAQDLRQIVASLKITGDLERIGDYAANVAKRSVVLDQFHLPFSLAGLGHMGRLVQENLKTVIDAAETNDADRARQVWQSDDVIDEMHTTRCSAS